MKLGLDLSGVVRKNMRGDPKNPNYLERDAIPSIWELVQTIGKENCFIISKMVQMYQQPNKEALHICKFFEETGFLESNLVFVDEFEDRWTSKNEELARLGITHFVDDQLAVLSETPVSIKTYWYNSKLGRVDEIMQRARWNITQHRNLRYQNWLDLKQDLLLEFSKEIEKRE